MNIDLESVEGYVEKIVYRNVENGYTVLSLSSEDSEELTCVGTFSFINEGEYLKLTGTLVAHAVYGEQLKVEKYEVKEPTDLVSMERYLGSGAIKGVGAALATRIVRHFKEDTFRVIEDEPERLEEVKGISARIAREIAIQFEEKRELRSAMIFLQQYGISLNLGVKIYKHYGQRMYEILKNNPYKLSEDISGVGFRIADEIARKVGIGSDSDFRVKAGMLHVLQEAANQGHIYLTEEMLYQRTVELLGIEKENVEHHLMDMVLDKQVVVKKIDEENCVYSSYYYYAELNCAKMLMDLNISSEYSEKQFQKRMAYLEKEMNMELEDMQREAVYQAVKHGVLLITGGPGTGKTTTINAIIRYFEEEELTILLAAPTGRAAKRMSETTGYEAQTIHRLLELSGGMEDENSRSRFERNQENPLEADVIIVDEMSMVDLHLMYSLLKAVVVGTRLILVGDVNQLPSVGPGNVLKDIINSSCFSVVRLSKIFRQAAESDIIVNAHKINAGEKIALDNKSKDFFMLQRDDANRIINVIIQLVRDKLPGYVDAKSNDIQVLTPMRKGELGVERLNKILQEYLNPRTKDKKEKEVQGRIFREGDKVMQIKNNYQLEWEIKSKYGYTQDSGTGVFNGDCGIISEINTYAEQITVEYEEGKKVEYPFSGLDELEHAYAITIHKSQGSEYPAVVMPILTGPRMLFNRNLLYTAVTRAKKCVVIVGSDKMVENMIANVNEQKRCSSLDRRLVELHELSD
ncbi:MAG: ATP-dependent RecD-like DNA helicase [Lachnospiraceae bacterium]|nr:ATP-dependent RecD-like DNA helicase [Lachnospiraceae bacterium]